MGLTDQSINQSIHRGRFLTSSLQGFCGPLQSVCTCVVNRIKEGQHHGSAAMSVPPPLSFPTPGKTIPHHPLGDGQQVTVPHPPLGNCTTTVHAHLQAQKLQHKTKEFSIRHIQRAANVQRPTP